MRLAWPTLLLAVACSEERTTAPSGGVHPQGWADRSSSAFHGAWLAENSFPLTQCQQCHGDDYLGGAVGVSCVQSGCHSQPPIACTTCHGSRGTPRPSSGAHWAHQAYCDTCHVVPALTTASVERHASGDASTLIKFGSIAVESSRDWRFDAGASVGPPVWDAATQRCTGTYCHGAASPPWTTATPIECDGCHSAPPADHAAWSRVANGTSSCVTCHPAATAPTHANGVVNITVTSCTACHGGGDHAYPPFSLSGSTDPTTREVGAHEAHLDPGFPDRIADPLLCNDCHVVPDTVVAPGHLDQPTLVRFPFGGSFDASSASCNVWCHFNKAPGPAWTDDTGDAIRCEACHAFPPVLTRAGDPHPSVPGELSACLRCHPFGPVTHVNGVVDFLTP